MCAFIRRPGVEELDDGHDTMPVQYKSRSASLCALDLVTLSRHDARWQKSCGQEVSFHSIGVSKLTGPLCYGGEGAWAHARP